MTIYTNIEVGGINKTESCGGKIDAVFLHEIGLNLAGSQAMYFCFVHGAIAT